MFPLFTTACKARVSNKRVHFKHCREIGAAIQGMGLSDAIVYLENVLEKKEAVPFRVFTGGIGRHAQVISFTNPNAIAVPLFHLSAISPP